jgi:hypothetical protein
MKLLTIFLSLALMGTVSARATGHSVSDDFSSHLKSLGSALEAYSTAIKQGERVVPARAAVFEALKDWKATFLRHEQTLPEDTKKNYRTRAGSILTVQLNDLADEHLACFLEAPATRDDWLFTRALMADVAAMRY